MPPPEMAPVSVQADILADSLLMADATQPKQAATRQSDQQSLPALQPPRVHPQHNDHAIACFTEQVRNKA